MIKRLKKIEVNLILCYNQTEMKNNYNQYETDLDESSAMQQLMYELDAGLRSVEAKGWVDEDDLMRYFKEKKCTTILQWYMMN